METHYETVIGLEVHVELATATKIFCGCPTEFGGEVNTHTCPVCTGMPGALPVLNRQVVEHAIAVGLACGCRINRICNFDRKNYFYPDNPQNYQISQLYTPICQDGCIEIETEKGRKNIRIHEMHMEEDAGKLIHDEEKNLSYIDYNRSGVPLIEIVSEPDMCNGEEVIAYLERLRTIIQYLRASDCKLQEGSMRVDVNLSVRPEGSDGLGTRTEMKNLNSFKAITRAIREERRRQIELLERGEIVIQETRRWDDGAGVSVPMRSKEDTQDYRYFPEPDLLPLQISGQWIREIQKRQPEMRWEKISRYKNEFGLPIYDAEVLTDSIDMAVFFEEAVAVSKKPKKVSNWLMGETLRLLKESNMEAADLSFSPRALAELIDLVDEGVITQNVAKQVFGKMFDGGIQPKKYIEDKGLGVVRDEEILRSAINEVVETNPKSVADYKNGKEKAIGFLVGQTMKKMAGKADPTRVKEILREFL